MAKALQQYFITGHNMGKSVLVEAPTNFYGFNKGGG